MMRLDSKLAQIGKSVIIPVSMSTIMHRTMNPRCIKLFLYFRRGRQRGHIACIIGAPACPNCGCQQIRCPPRRRDIDQVVRPPLGVPQRLRYSRISGPGSVSCPSRVRPRPALQPLVAVLMKDCCAPFFRRAPRKHLGLRGRRSESRQRRRGRTWCEAAFSGPGLALDRRRPPPRPSARVAAKPAPVRFPRPSRCGGQRVLVFGWLSP